MARNIKSLSLLRNGKIYLSKQLASQALTQSHPTNDGVAKLARYLEEKDGVEYIRTLVGFYANANEMEDAGGGRSCYTVLDVDGNAADVSEIRAEISDINNKIGDGIDGTTLTIAINDINSRIGEGFSEVHTVADTLSQLEVAMTLHLSKSEEEAQFVYTLTQGDTIVGTIDIAKDIFIQYAVVVRGYWDGDTFTEDPYGPDKAIKLVFQSELHDPLYINIQDLVSLYVGGDGIDITDDVVSITIDGDSEAFLTVSENGLKLQGVQVAIDDAIEAAKLHESDGIKILANNKIKAHAASILEDGIVNPIYVDEDGIKLDKVLDMGFYDYETVVNEIPTGNTEMTNLVLTTQNAIENLTANTEYNSITIAGGEINGDDIKAIAKQYLTVDGVTVSGSKGASNGKVLFSASTVNINVVNVPNGATVYNVFEGYGGIDKPEYFVNKFNASNVVVDNPLLKHNVFNIYALKDNAVITIKDSYFNINAANSNVLRLANLSNATGVTINFENITWTYENGDTSEPEYAGLVLYQPYSTDVALNGDTSKIATWKINIKDCVYNGVKVNSNNFGRIDQVAYGYGINHGGTANLADILIMTFE